MPLAENMRNFYFCNLLTDTGVLVTQNDFSILTINLEEGVYGPAVCLVILILEDAYAKNDTLSMPIEPTKNKYWEFVLINRVCGIDYKHISEALVVLLHRLG